MILEGKAVAGMGRAKIFVNMMKDVFYKKTNMKLYPGTLNIELNEPYNLKSTYTIKAEEYGGKYDVQVQECVLLEQKAYIVRSGKNLKEESDYERNIIEIVSNINFREKYNLKDGDLVKIQVLR